MTKQDTFNEQLEAFAARETQRQPPQEWLEHWKATPEHAPPGGDALTAWQQTQQTPSWSPTKAVAWTASLTLASALVLGLVWYHPTLPQRPTDQRGSHTPHIPAPTPRPIPRPTPRRVIAQVPKKPTSRTLIKQLTQAAQGCLSGYRRNPFRPSSGSPKRTRHIIRDNTNEIWLVLPAALRDLPTYRVCSQRRIREILRTNHATHRTIAMLVSHLRPRTFRVHAIDLKDTLERLFPDRMTICFRRWLHSTKGRYIDTKSRLLMVLSKTGAVQLLYHGLNVQPTDIAYGMKAHRTCIQEQLKHAHSLDFPMPLESLGQLLMTDMALKWRVMHSSRGAIKFVFLRLESKRFDP